MTLIVNMSRKLLLISSDVFNVYNYSILLLLLSLASIFLSLSDENDINHKLKLINNNYDANKFIFKFYLHM